MFDVKTPAPPTSAAAVTAALTNASAVVPNDTKALFAPDTLEGLYARFAAAPLTAEHFYDADIQSFMPPKPAAVIPNNLKPLEPFYTAELNPVGDHPAIKLMQMIKDGKAFADAKQLENSSGLHTLELCTERDTAGYNVLMYAAIFGHRQALTELHAFAKIIYGERHWQVLLLPHPKHQLNVFYLAAVYGQLEIFKQLFSYLPKAAQTEMQQSLTQAGKNRLQHYAAASGSVAFIEHLLELAKTAPHPNAVADEKLNATPMNPATLQNVKGENILDISADGNHAQLAQHLYETHSLPITALLLRRQITRNNFAVVKYLCPRLSAEVLNEADPSTGQTAIMMAAAKGDLASVICLGERLTPAHLDVQDKEGQTAVILAAKGNHIAIVHYLHSKKANLDLFTAAGVPAVWVAAEQIHIDMVMNLIALGANVALKRPTGNLPCLLKTLLGKLPNPQMMVALTQFHHITPLLTYTNYANDIDLKTTLADAINNYKKQLRLRANRQPNCESIFINSFDKQNLEIRAAFFGIAWLTDEKIADWVFKQSKYPTPTAWPAGFEFAAKSYLIKAGLGIRASNGTSPPHGIHVESLRAALRVIAKITEEPKKKHYYLRVIIQLLRKLHCDVAVAKQAHELMPEFYEAVSGADLNANNYDELRIYAYLFAQGITYDRAVEKLAKLSNLQKREFFENHLLKLPEPLRQQALNKTQELVDEKPSALRKIFYASFQGVGFHASAAAAGDWDADAAIKVELAKYPPNDVAYNRYVTSQNFCGSSS